MSTKINVSMISAAMKVAEAIRQDNAVSDEELASALLQLKTTIGILQKDFLTVEIMAQNKAHAGLQLDMFNDQGVVRTTEVTTRQLYIPYKKIKEDSGATLNCSNEFSPYMNVGVGRALIEQAYYEGVLPPTISSSCIDKTQTQIALDIRLEPAPATKKSN